MTWNWQQRDWPNFAWNQQRLNSAEQEFLVGGGIFVGAVRRPVGCISVDCLQGLEARLLKSDVRRPSCPCRAGSSVPSHDLPVHRQTPHVVDLRNLFGEMSRDAIRSFVHTFPSVEAGQGGRYHQVARIARRLWLLRGTRGINSHLLSSHAA